MRLRSLETNRFIYRIWVESTSIYLTPSRPLMRRSYLIYADERPELWCFYEFTTFQRRQHPVLLFLLRPNYRRWMHPLHSVRDTFCLFTRWPLFHLKKNKSFHSEHWIVISKFSYGRFIQRVMPDRLMKRLQIDGKVYGLFVAKYVCLAIYLLYYHNAQVKTNPCQKHLNKIVVKYHIDF